MSLRGVWAVFRYEGKRSLRLSRLIWWVLLAFVPLLLASLMTSQHSGALDRDEEVAMFLYILVVRALCPLALLLWATPAIHGEIEGKTWSYIAVRPGGRASVLFGKYLVAVAWAAGVGFVAILACLAGVHPHGLPRLWKLFVELSLLASVSYGAIYLLIGVLFLKRAMVVAVAYTFIVEVALTAVPAVVNQLTVDFRLRTLLVKGLGLGGALPRASREWISEGTSAEQVGFLAAYTAVALAVSAIALRRRQLVVADD